jgi:hypothetical protein
MHVHVRSPHQGGVRLSRNRSISKTHHFFNSEEKTLQFSWRKAYIINYIKSHFHHMQY